MKEGGEIVREMKVDEGREGDMSGRRQNNFRVTCMYMYMYINM